MQGVVRVSHRPCTQIRPSGRLLHGPRRRKPPCSPGKFAFRRAYTGVRERQERSQESLGKMIPRATQLVPQRFGICEACVLRPLQAVPGRTGRINLTVLRYLSAYARMLGFSMKRRRARRGPRSGRLRRAAGRRQSQIGCELGDCPLAPACLLSSLPNAALHRRAW